MEHAMRSLRVVTAGCASVALVGCGGATAGDKAGGDTASVTLRIGTDDIPGRPGAEQIEHFAVQVEELTGGEVSLDPVWRAAGRGADDWDQVVARQVIEGTLDMGLIPARAWDTEGVTSLQALHAPFLVTSDQLLERIVTDDRLPEQMLAGLEEAGVEGLALLPEGVRYTFSFGEPLVSPDQFAGAVIRAPRSETTYAVLEALGATPDDFPGAAGDAAYEKGIADGSVAAAESSFQWANALNAPTTAVGNLGLFPKANALVVNRDTFEELTAEHQAALTKAAERTLDWAVETLPGDAELAEQYCRNGGTVALADEDEVAAMHAATAAVREGLERDPSSRQMIERIRVLRDEVETTRPHVAACEPQVTPSAGEPGGAGTFPDGVYRMEISTDFLESAGVDAADAYNHAGTWTLTFAAGELTVQDVTDASGRQTDNGVYCLEGDRVVLGLLGEPPECGDFWSARWRLQGDELHFLDVRSHHGSDVLVEALFGGQPFRKIG